MVFHAKNNYQSVLGDRERVHPLLSLSPVLLEPRFEAVNLAVLLCPLID